MRQIAIHARVPQHRKRKGWYIEGEREDKHPLSQAGSMTLRYRGNQVSLTGKSECCCKALNDDRDGSLKSGHFDGVVDVSAVESSPKDVHMILLHVAFWCDGPNTERVF
jgi:hypothetical protein